ncbi:MAG TPA: Rieske (2Fe-2S) protein [Candidatus Limnocylindrales bacterium]
MTWHRAAPLDELRAARPWLPLTIEGVDLVVAVVDGVPYAVEDRCAHAGCAFSEDADLVGDDIVCNCHGSEFDLRTGALKRGPAERPVRSIPVRIEGEHLEVAL